MNFNFNNKYIRLLLYAIMFLASAFFIFKMFPKRNNFDKHYELGKPWQYDLYMAPFDFPIYKTDLELQTERDSIRSFFAPYYIISQDKGRLAIASFLSDTSIKGDEKYHLQRALQKIYKIGIMPQSDFENIHNLNIKSINVTDSSNIWKKIEADNIFTPSSAIAYIADKYPITISRLDSLDVIKYLSSNLSIDKNKSDLALNELIKTIPISNGMVQAGERIIDKGDIVKLWQLKILNSLKKEYNEFLPQKNNIMVSLAQFLLILGLMSLFVIYILLFRPEFIRLKNMLFFTIMTLIIVGFASFIMNNNPDMINIVPFTLMAIVIRIFFDSRTALFIHNIVVLIVSLFVPSPFAFVILHITAGMIAVSTLKQLTHRSQLIQSAIFIFITYSLLYSFFSIVETGSISLSWHPYIIFAINAILLLFAYILIYIFEKIFGYLSDVTLVELSNINSKLLMDFSQKAPGTFQHVIQVSTLSAAMAQKINANTLLARTGALYHDIGKMKNPICFSENQMANISPLNNMSNEEAAKIIIAHVEDGVKIAEQNGLPNQLIRFIRSHHAKTITKYFYIKEKNENKEAEVDREKFTYKGILPTTKEEAIVMIADSVEAASRSLQDYNEQTINDLVEDIINCKIAEQTLKDSPLTFKHIEIIKYVLKEKLLNIYHSRIQYPK